MDDFFSSSNNGNATSHDEPLDQALINLVPVPNDVQGGSGRNSDDTDPLGIF